MDLFDIIGDNFFSPLSSKNKRLYHSAIIETFKVYETGSILGIDKKIVVDNLAYFLEKNSFNLLNEDDKDLDDLEIKSKRDLANFILRKMESCGWIYIDVNNDYTEILNFSDAGITIVEALLQIEPIIYSNEESEEYIRQTTDEYHGYIYTIYSLLINEENVEYGLLISQIYKNTKMLIRSLRKLDSRLKDYIHSVVDTSEIKDLMEKLISYKQELFDQTYSKIKTSDNINKYRLPIVMALEEIQRNEVKMAYIAQDYKIRTKTMDLAYKRANRDIDEVIDVFNQLEDLITEIDYKNKTYINSTIGKIKFLLTEDDNIIGKLNSILKFVKTENKNQKLDKALNIINPIIKLGGNRSYNDTSLYSPRGSYSYNYNQILDMTRFDDLEMTGDFLNQFKVPYNEILVGEFLKNHLVNGVLKASDIIKYDTDVDTVMQSLYCVLFASERDFKVSLSENKVYHHKFTMRDFEIAKRG